VTRLPAAERRAQLVEAAIRVMTRDGVARATTRSIAADADVSLSVFHYCFTSKQELLEAVIEAIMQHAVTPAISTIAPGRTLETTVRGGLQAYWDHVTAYPDEHRLTYELTQYAVRTPGFEDVARRQYERYLDANREFIEQLQRTYPLEIDQPVPVLARYVASLLDGVTLNYLVLGDATGAGEVLDLVTAHLLTLIRVADHG
jgi:AcrR family transcriptional regulator